MAKRSKSSAVHRMPSIRPGEGVPIDVESRTSQDSSGRTVQILQGDMSSAPVPDRKYSGDIVDVVWHRGMVRLMFAQEQADLVSLRSLLVVNLGPGCVRAFLRSLQSLDSGDTLEQVAIKNGVTAEPLTEIKSDPVHTIGLRANHIVMAVASDEACLDFYQSSAFAIRAGNLTRKFAVDPIVRVEISFALLLSIVTKLESLAKEFPTGSDIDIKESV